jgi:hypothetical protein
MLNLPQTWHAYALKPGKYFRKVRTLRSNLCLSPHEYSFCSSETKHNRRKVPKLKVVVLMRLLKEQRPQPKKAIQFASLSEDVFCALGTNDSR